MVRLNERHPLVRLWLLPVFLTEQLLNRDVQVLQ